MNALTQPQQNRRHFSQRPTWRRQPVISLGPTDPGTVQPGVDVVPAQSLGLGHQLLVSGWAVKNFSGKHGGAAQHLHAAGAALRASALRRRSTSSGFSWFIPFLNDRKSCANYSAQQTCGFLCEQVSIVWLTQTILKDWLKNTEKKIQTNHVKNRADTRTFVRSRPVSQKSF